MLISLVNGTNCLYTLSMVSHSVHRAAKDMGVDDSVARARVMESAPRILWVKRMDGYGKVEIRNRPAFFAWWYGFGLGAAALDAFRDWARANGKEKLADEPEPASTNFHMKSETMLKIHERRRGNANGND